MDYQLCKELKEAGFDQEMDVEDPNRWYDDDKEISITMYPKDNYVYIPILPDPTRSQTPTS